MQRSNSGGSDLFAEPLTPLGNSRREEQVSPNEFSPGLLDLHSFDTELLPEVCSLINFAEYFVVNLWECGLSFDCWGEV